MPVSTYASYWNVNGALSKSRSRNTFKAQMLRDKAQKLELAERIKQLREQSPYTQPAIADQIGLALRSYQKVEQTGGISYERLQQLAELHGVSTNWLLTGKERAATPNPLEKEAKQSNDNELEQRLASMDEKLDELRAKLDAMSQGAGDFSRSSFADAAEAQEGPFRPLSEDDQQTEEDRDDSVREQA